MVACTAADSTTEQDIRKSQTLVFFFLLLTVSICIRFSSQSLFRKKCWNYYNEEVNFILVSLTISSSSPVTDHKDNERKTFNCSVSTYDQCRYTVKWVYEGKDVDKVNKYMQISQSYCSSAVFFLTSSLECEVTDKYSGKVKLFAFNPPSSDEKTGVKIMNSIKSFHLATRVQLQYEGYSHSTGCWDSFIHMFRIWCINNNSNTRKWHFYTSKLQTQTCCFYFKMTSYIFI